MTPMSHSPKRDNVFPSMVDVDKLVQADDADLRRLAAWVGAKVAVDSSPLAWKYRQACNIMRAIKRGTQPRA